MLKRFVAVREDRPGAAWLRRFKAGRSEAENWYFANREAAFPMAAECRTALQQYMPELLAPYDQACALVGDDEIAHRLLSHYRPPPLVFACTQTVWLGEGGPALVRNYDYPLNLVSDAIESSAWFGREVIGKAQRPWGGCLDGMNVDGLVASATFGGSRAEGLGFSIILMLRYVLETCRRVDEAVAALVRIPIALSQNVTLLDRAGNFATLFLGPDRIPMVSRTLTCANHQDTPASLELATSTGSVGRHAAATAAVTDSAMTLPDLTLRFLAPPLYSRKLKSPTVYTAVYRPAEGSVDYLWPGKRWRQRMGKFQPGDYAHDYGELAR